MTAAAEHRRWISVGEVLHEELLSVRPEWTDVPKPPSESATEPEALRAVYKAIAEHACSPGGKLSALCLSGGGIRSATFNLGVLQALARADLLHRFDYLSTVSGGGYIGSWLQAWIAHERELARNPPARPSAPRPTEAERLRAGGVDPQQIVMTLLCRPGRTPEEARDGEGKVDDPVRPEPEPIDRLREFSNYLTPRTGLLSGDTWTIVAIVLRNLLLNWLVIVPVIAAALILPQLAYLVATSRVPGASDMAGAPALPIVALVLGFLSSLMTHWLRTERRCAPLPGERMARRAEQRLRRRWRGWVSFGAHFFLVSAAALFVLAATWSGDHPWETLPGAFVGGAGDRLGTRAVHLAIWTVGLPIAGMVAARLARARAGEKFPVRTVLAEGFALAASGYLAALALGWLMGEPWERVRSYPSLIAALAVPVLLVLYALSRALVTALEAPFMDASPAEPDRGDSDREWWARMTGRVLLVAVGWAVVTGLVLLGTWLRAGGRFGELHRALSGAVAALGAASGLVTGFLGKSGDTRSGRGGPPTSRWREAALRLVAPATVALLIVLLAFGTAWLERAISGDPCFLVVEATPTCPPSATTWTMAKASLEVLLGLILVSAVAGWFVNINRFSLHAMYRSRLVRAYLGASNLDRRPNPITGFDEEDERLTLADLKRSAGDARGLFPIVNVTLNLISGERLAWQERRAESFSMTPLHCGNFHEGYRRTDSYGHARPEGNGGGAGISLGTAMAISGAAANPNMGYVSTPALTFLMALLNARLGVWLPNTNQNGGERVDCPGPRHASSHLVKEMLGLTTRYAPFVNLSDGGHFENLGLYEVVLRRCRFVFVSDASCDPRHGFGDLGNAIRKIRIDFGIPIEFQKEIEIRPRLDGDGTQPRAGLYCAIARIRYDVPDGADAAPGTLVYVKPTLQNGERSTIPYDVRAFANSSEAFPHESTVDQWFSEAQFESYRALGAHLVETILGHDPLESLQELEDSLRWYVDHKEALSGFAQALDAACEVPARSAQARGASTRPPPVESPPAPTGS